MLLIRLWTIITAIIGGILMTVLILKPYVLEPLCLINTNKCIQISFKKFKNSVLVHMQPTGYWWWFNGRYIYVYGLPTGRECEDSSRFEPCFVVDAKTRKTVGYECVTVLSDITKFYDEKNAKEQHIFVCSKEKNFNIYDAFDQLVLKNIIQIPSEKPPELTFYRK
jgi:hypothetical protein